MKTHLIIVLWFLGISLQAKVNPEVFVPADDPNYSYTGRFDFSDKKQAVGKIY